MFRMILCTFLAACSLVAMAEPIDLRPTLQLDASASNTVPEDVAHATLFVERENENAVTAQQQVNRVLATAVAKAKLSPSVDTKTGRAQTRPTYGKDGRITAWRVRGELVLESKATAELSQLVTQLTETMSVDKLGFSLSEDARNATQQSLQAEAITSFKTKAQTATKQLGYAQYTLDKVQLIYNNTMPSPRPMAYMAKGVSMESSAPVSMESGKTTVSVSVSGTVRLER